jgi:HEPN domain-containing protein
MVLSEAEGFLKMARADLATALESSDPARFREAAWGFWLQQAAEKGLKAWLHQLNLLPPRSHDLARLLLILKDAGAPAFRKDDTPLNRKPGGLMEQSNASLQRGDQG